jgi:hypothetical protein
MHRLNNSVVTALSTSMIWLVMYDVDRQSGCVLFCDKVQNSKSLQVNCTAQKTEIVRCVVWTLICNVKTRCYINSNVNTMI